MGDLPLLLAAIFAAGFLRGVTGFGFALAAVPFISMVVPPLHAVIVVQILQLAMAPIDLAQNHKHIDRRSLTWLFAGAALVAPGAAMLATRLNPDVMRTAVALFVLLGLFAILREARIPAGRGPALSAGAMAGLMAGLAAMPGPPAVAYFLGRGTDKAVSRASLLVFFAGTAGFVLLTMMMTSQAVTWAIGKTALIGLPALLAGTMLGTKLFERLGDGSYRKAALAVLLISALMTGYKGLSGLL